MNPRIALTLLTAFLGVPVLGHAQDGRFDAAVAPLLIERCIDCHSGLKPKGKLDLTRAEVAEVPIEGKVNVPVWIPRPPAFLARPETVGVEVDGKIKANCRLL